jgi:hypothetical protein
MPRHYEIWVAKVVGGKPGMPGRLYTTVPTPAELEKCLGAVSTAEDEHWYVRSIPQKEPGGRQPEKTCGICNGVGGNGDGYSCMGCGGSGTV